MPLGLQTTTISTKNAFLCLVFTDPDDAETFLMELSGFLREYGMYVHCIMASSFENFHIKSTLLKGHLNCFVTYYITCLSILIVAIMSTNHVNHINSLVLQ